MPIQIALPNLFAAGTLLGSLAGPDGLIAGLLVDRQPVAFAPSTDPANPNRIQSQAPGWTMTDTLEILPGGSLRVTRAWRNLTGAARSAALLFELYRPGPLDFYLIPAVNYNGNPFGNGSEPKGLSRGPDPASTWVYGGDRTSIPACTITETGGWAAGLYTEPVWAAQSACSLRQVGSGLVQQIRWPLQELPELYARRDVYRDGIFQELTIPPGGEVTRAVYLTFQPVEPGSHACPAILDAAWQRFYTPFPAPHSPEQLWQLGLRFAKESLWYQDERFTGFALGRMLHGREWRWPTHNLSEIAWCGQNGTLACMFLHDFITTGSEDSWQRGASALDEWVKTCRLENGLIYTRIEDGWSRDPHARLEVCNLGGGAYAFLLAAGLAEKAGRPRPAWLATGLGICDFFTRHILPDGRFGRYWSASGELLDPQGTVGSWMAWPLLLAYRMTGRAEYLETARRGFAYYTSHDLARACITAGALDTDCIDKEGAFPLLMAAIDLYEITGEAAYLARAEQAAAYLATWQWHYDLSYPPGSAAGQTGYQTQGGTSVSVQHHHLDPWAALIALGWLRLGRLTGNPVWTERARAAWRQAACGVSDGQMAIHGVTRPAGGQDEGFYHTRWGGQPGEVSNWLVAWPTAFRLFTLQQWEDWGDL